MVFLAIFLNQSRVRVAGTEVARWTVRHSVRWAVVASETLDVGSDLGPSDVAANPKPRQCELREQIVRMKVGQKKTVFEDQLRDGDDRRVLRPSSHERSCR